MIGEPNIQSWTMNGTTLQSQSLIGSNPGGAWQVAIDGTGSSLGAPRAAEAIDYPLVINARVDNFLSLFIAGAEAETQRQLVPEALERASAYLEAGADCVYPIALWEPEALRLFMSEVRGPVNVSRVPQVSSVADLAALGVSRVSWALYLYFASMAHFEDQLRSLQ